MNLQVRPLRFEFRAQDPLWFPAGKAANIFRGAFGEIFRRIACTPDCPGAKLCLRSQDCAYARMFEPRATEGPSGFHDSPRPFVLRAAALDEKRFEPGERFTLDINTFDPSVDALSSFRAAFEQLVVQGLGPGRPGVELMEANELPPVELSLTPRAEPVNRIRIHFLTPTELKSGGEILRAPHFGPLFKRARDRVAGIINLYQMPGEPLELDFRALGDLADSVQMTESNIRQAEYERRSSRTGQTHSLGGFTGHAGYEGELAAFLPFLEAAAWTGVGRLTVWGNGAIRTAAQANCAVPTR